MISVRLYRSVSVINAGSSAKRIPLTKSPSQCPTPVRSFTAAGRNSIESPYIFLFVALVAVLIALMRVGASWEVSCCLAQAARRRCSDTQLSLKGKPCPGRDRSVRSYQRCVRAAYE